MAQTKLIDKFKSLEIALKIKLRAKILDKGTVSKYNSERVLKVKDDQMFNLKDGRYLTEISPTSLNDNEGYSYDFSVLRIEELCEAVDNV